MNEYDRTMRLDFFIWLKENNNGEFDTGHFNKYVEKYFENSDHKILSTGWCFGEVPDEDIGECPYDE